jgi:hypothetical protein
MLFGTGSRKRLSLFATHPPLADRIKALDPSFDPAQLTELAQRWAQSPPNGMAEDEAAGLAAQPASPPAPALWDGSQVVARVAAPDDAAYRRATSLLREIPDEVRTRAHSVDSVVPLVFGLLLSADPRVSARQQADLAQRYDPRISADAQADAVRVAGLDPVLRLPLAQLAFPALRHRSAAEQQAVLAAVHALIYADWRINIFEYCFSALLRDELYEAMHPPPRWRSGSRPLRDCREEVVTLLSVLADSEPAFRAGMAVALPGDRGAYQTRPVVELEGGWQALRELAPAGKQRLIAAAVEVIGQDRVITVSEVELLRTICALLHCPLPPLVSAGSAGHNP